MLTLRALVLIVEKGILAHADDEQNDLLLLLLLLVFITRYLHPSCLATLGMNLKREAVYD